MATIIAWDYREQPNWDAVNDALVKEFERLGELPVLSLVPDTGSDQYVLVVGVVGLYAQRFWDEACPPCRFGDHDECSSGSCSCRTSGSCEGE